MSVSIAEFDTSNVAPAGDFTPVPDGEYTVAVVNSERKESKATPGCFYISVECDILDGEYKGRKLFDNLNLWHSSQKAQEMALRTLAALKIAANKPDAKDFMELHDIPITAKVKCVKRQDNGEMKNEIKAYLTPETAAPPSRRRATAPSKQETSPPSNGQGKPDTSFLD